jgi:carbonic anhydrase/acetyltransferase-like protein (isoleucine patch superfamily)
MPIYSLAGQMPDLPPTGQYYVADGAVVVGKVRIRAGASVWFGAVLRGDNEWIELGERTNVQDNCTLHTDPGFPLTVGSGCTIGHNAVLHGCTIGDNTLIGMGAILLNGARVGASCIVGAGALIGAKNPVPDHCLVIGSPARKDRDIDDATVKLIEKSAEIYFRRWQNYAANLKLVT